MRMGVLVTVSIDSHLINFTLAGNFVKCLMNSPKYSTIDNTL